MVAQKVGDLLFVSFMFVFLCSPFTNYFVFLFRLSSRKEVLEEFIFSEQGLEKRSISYLIMHKNALESWKSEFAVFLISGLFQVRGSPCLHSDMWRFVPRNQHSNSGDSMWLELYVWCS